MTQLVTPAVPHAQTIPRCCCLSQQLPLQLQGAPGWPRAAAAVLLLLLLALLLHWTPAAGPVGVGDRRDGGLLFQT